MTILSASHQDMVVSMVYYSMLVGALLYLYEEYGCPYLRDHLLNSKMGQENFERIEMGMRYGLVGVVVIIFLVAFLT